MSYGNLSNVRVTSEGVPHTTEVRVGDTAIIGVTSIKWQMKSLAHVAELTLTIEGADISADALRILIGGSDS